MDSLLIIAIALVIAAIIANLSLAFGVDSRDGFGLNLGTGLS
jgi:hypothetical protein